MRFPVLPLARALLSTVVLLSPAWGQMSGVDRDQSRVKRTSSLPPEALFKRLSPSVFVVEALGQQGGVTSYGSGVAIGPDLVVTNVHVIEDSEEIRVSQGSKSWPASVTVRDDFHDLCLLGVTGLSAIPVSVQPSSGLAVGERVYSLSSPVHLELTFSEGIISGFRINKQARMIQTTAPLSQGSSGGGLFDAQGRLVGITTFSLEEGQGLNFAVPGDLVLALRLSTARRKREIHDRPGEPGDKPDVQIGRGNRDPDLSDIGKEALESGRWEEAIQAYKEYVRLNPDDAGGWKGLGNAYYESASQTKWFSTEEVTSYGAAAGAYQEALRLTPDDAEVWKALGDATDLNNPDQAIPAYRQAIRLQPENAGAYRALGNLFRRRGDLKAAIHEYQEVLRLVPEDSSMHAELGGTLKDSGDLDAAILEYREAVRLEPENQMWHYHLGAALEERHDFNAAIQEYRRSIQLNAKGGTAFYLPHLELGICYLMLGQRDSALEEYKKLADEPGAAVDADELFEEIINNTAAPGASGVVGGEITWDLPEAKTAYSFSLHNLQQGSVKEVHYIVIFYGPDDKPIDSKRGVYLGEIASGLAVRVNGEPVDGSVNRLVKRVAITVLGFVVERQR